MTCQLINNTLNLLEESVDEILTFKNKRAL